MDIRSSCIFVWIPIVGVDVSESPKGIPPIEQEPMLADIQKQIQLEQERLISYIQKSYKARIKWVKQGKIDQVICSEIGACLAAGRMDLVENLVSRKARLQSLNSLVDQMEYQRRFRNDEVILPPEESLEKENGITTLNTDSTQKQ